MYHISKTIFDLIAALLAIIILCPLLIIIALFIIVSSKGPVIFKQQRAGKNGKPFTFYKFRTMRTDADPYGSSPKSADDPRITPIGKFLREYSLDELPQLFNIVKLDMSLVGPRPLYISQVQEWTDHQKKRLLAKPGLTGLAQISGRGQLTREEKIELDVKYVEIACFSIDIAIIAKTIAHVFSKKDIYENKYSQTEETRGQNTEDSKQ